MIARARRTAGGLTLAAGALASALGAQAPADATPVRILLLDVPVATALERLAVAGPMNIVWDAATVKAARAPRISCRLPSATPEQALGCVTREAGLDWYRLSSGTYVVIPRSEAAPGYASLAGLVVDAATGTPVESARITVGDDPTRRAAGPDGRFAFDRLLPGPQDVLVQAIGYRPQRLRLELGREARLRTRVVLEPVAEAALPIVVNGLRVAGRSAALGTSEHADSAVATLIAPPALVLPGGAAPLGLSRRDGIGDLHLQGGDVGEHPWQLDGVPLFDAAALSGLLGVAAPVALERLTIHRSGFRASHGSFAAGAISLAHALGDPRRRAASAVLVADPLAVSARVTAPVRLAGATGQGMLAWREGTWGWTAPSALTGAMRAWSAPDAVLLQRISGFGALPGMHDLEQGAFQPGGRESVALRDIHAAGRLGWGDLQSVEASAFRMSHAVAWGGTASDAQQRTLGTRDAYAWRTTGGQVAYQRLLGTRIRQSLQVRGVVHDLAHDAAMAMTNSPGVAAMRGREGNRIEEVGLRAEWSTSLASGSTLAGGVDAAQTRGSVALANGVLRPLAAAGRVARLTAWGDATWPLGAGAWLESGVRVTQLETGRTYAEPRLALRGEGGGTRPWAWRVGGGGYHQFVSQFDVASTAPMAFVPSVRFWLPMDGRSGVATAWHASGEVVLRPWSRWEVRAEGYARWQPQLPMLDYGALFGMGAGAPAVVTMDAFIRQARGRAAGGGVRAVHDDTTAGLPTRLELAWDVGIARRTFPSRFGGTEQPVPWLEPHRVQAALDVGPVTGLTVGVRGRGVFGRPWALRQAYYDLFGAAPMAAGLPLDDPGAMRRPALLDLDVGATYERRIGSARVTIGASVTNLLDRANVLDFGLQRDPGAATYRMVPRLLPRRMPAVTLRITP